MFESPTYLRREFPNLTQSEAERIMFDLMDNVNEIDAHLSVNGRIDSDDEEGNNGIEPPEKSYWNENGKYQPEYDRLYEKYVPAKGPADTPQGNLLRLMSKLYYRCYNDGDTNFGVDEYGWMYKESPIPDDAVEFKDNFEYCISDGDELEHLMELGSRICDEEGSTRGEEAYSKWQSLLASCACSFGAIKRRLWG